MSAEASHALNNSEPDGPQHKKQKRTRLSVAQKLEIVEQLKNGTTKTSVMRSFNISRRTVSNIRTNIAGILHKAEEGSKSFTMKSIRPVLYPEVEQHLLEFMTFCRAAKMPVTQNTLQAKALIIRDDIIRGLDSPMALRHIENFNASRGWRRS